VAKALDKRPLRLRAIEQLPLAQKLLQLGQKGLHLVGAPVLEFRPEEEIDLGVSKGVIIAELLDFLEKGAIGRRYREIVAHLLVVLGGRLLPSVRAEELLEDRLPDIPWVLIQNTNQYEYKTMASQINGEPTP
jgi:hypothetical protein